MPETSAAYDALWTKMRTMEDAAAILATRLVHTVEHPEEQVHVLRELQDLAGRIGDSHSQAYEAAIAMLKQQTTRERHVPVAPVEVAA